MRPTLRPLVLVLASLCPAAQAQEAPHPDPAPASIAQKTASMTNMAGLLPLHWDANAGKLYLEVPLHADGHSDEFIYTNSLPYGTGSNDLGLDRGQTSEGRIVRFERTGPKLLLVQPNEAFRSSASDPAEQLSVRQSFPSSVLAGFKIEASTPTRASASEDATSVLVDATDFFLRDVHGVQETLARMQQGAYKVDPARSTIVLHRTKAFPRNTEVEALLTFTTDSPTGGRHSFVADVTPDPHALTLHEHQSFIALPPPGFTPRRFDPRAGYFPSSYRDYSVPLGDGLDQQFILRHRLIKKDPACRQACEAEAPIQYYVDRGAPEPIRTALVEGARWWDQAFRAAGWAKGTFRVDPLPADADAMDVRYNIIQWVHRYTRGWSYGAAVADPRTGEIIKGNVTLGSLRGRQDYLIAEALLSPYVQGSPLTSQKSLSPSPEHLSPSPEPLSPSPEHLSPSPEHLSPSPEHLSPSQEHLSPSPEHLSLSPEHLSPSPERLSSFAKGGGSASASASPSASRPPTTDPMLAMVLQRIRQLAAHETGHTLGLAHNFAASAFPHANPDETISVMDYPHPYITLGQDGVPDLSHAYPVNIGTWDKVAIDYGYRQFPARSNEAAELNKIIAASEATGLLYITDEDARPLGGAHPHAHLWDNGADPADELTRILTIRAAALKRFGQNAIKPGTPLAQLEDTLVPLFLLHRYQAEAAIKEIGGLDYRYNLRGDGQPLPKVVEPAQQKKALDAVLETLTPQTLTLPEEILALLPPRTPGLERTRESFPSHTGLTFDPVAAAESSADLTLSVLLNPERASRLIEYHMRSPGSLSLRGVLEAVSKTTAERPGGGHTLPSEVERAVEFRGLEAMLALAVNPQASSQARAIARSHMADVLKQLTSAPPLTDTAEAIHRAALIDRLQDFERDPARFIPAKPIEAPPGMPIGDDEE